MQRIFIRTNRKKLVFFYLAIVYIKNICIFVLNNIKQYIMKLELKHLSPYLPYGLKIQTQDKNGILIKTVDGIYEQYKDGSFMLYWQENYGTIQASGNIKLILRPLSDLTKEITVNGETFVPINELNDFYGFDYLWKYLKGSFNNFNHNAVAMASINKLLEWHFDIFGLIENGLSIDINTLQR